MNAKVLVSKVDYGGFIVHNWNLVVSNENGEQRNFFLGQDVKFCRRILGLHPRDVVKAIGSAEIEDEDVSKRLGCFIIEHLELDEDVVFNVYEDWDLACQ